MYFKCIDVTLNHTLHSFLSSHFDTTTTTTTTNTSIYFFTHLMYHLTLPSHINWMKMHEFWYDKREISFIALLLPHIYDEFNFLLCGVFYVYIYPIYEFPGVHTKSSIFTFYPFFYDRLISRNFLISFHTVNKNWIHVLWRVQLS